jgi:hypothetical protein
MARCLGFKQPLGQPRRAGGALSATEGMAERALTLASDLRGLII